MREIPEGTTHLDTVDDSCRPRKVTDIEVFAYSGYEWYLIPVSASEAVEDNHYIKLAACYAEGGENVE